MENLNQSPQTERRPGDPIGPQERSPSHSGGFGALVGRVLHLGHNRPGAHEGRAFGPQPTGDTTLSQGVLGVAPSEAGVPRVPNIVMRGGVITTPQEAVRLDANAAAQKAEAPADVPRGGYTVEEHGFGRPITPTLPESNPASVGYKSESVLSDRNLPTAGPVQPNVPAPPAAPAVEVAPYMPAGGTVSATGPMEPGKPVHNLPVDPGRA